MLARLCTLAWEHFKVPYSLRIKISKLSDFFFKKSFCDKNFTILQVINNAQLKY